MSVTLPETVDVWRMVSSRRSFHGTLPVAALKRLGEVLADDAGTVAYTLDFDRGELGTPTRAVHADASVPLPCEGSPGRAVSPLTADSRRGLIRGEREGAGLPRGFEPLMGTDDRGR